MQSSLCEAGHIGLRGVPYTVIWILKNLSLTRGGADEALPKALSLKVFTYIKFHFCRAGRSSMSLLLVIYERELISSTDCVQQLVRTMLEGGIRNFRTSYPCTFYLQDLHTFGEQGWRSG